MHFLIIPQERFDQELLLIFSVMLLYYFIKVPSLQPKSHHNGQEEDIRAGIEFPVQGISDQCKNGHDHGKFKYPINKLPIDL